MNDISAKVSGNARTDSKAGFWVSVLIFLLGTSSLTVSAFSQENENFLMSFRYMTVNGTAFSTLVSTIVIFISASKTRSGAEHWQNRLYFLRLSSAVTEIIIAVVIAMSFLPSVPDDPDLLSYDSFNMHIVIPLLSVISFLLHPTSARKTGILAHLRCAWLITLYAAVIILLIVFGMIPKEMIPYSFLDIHSMPVWYILAFGFFIFSFVYVLSFLLTDLQYRLCFIRNKKTEPVSSR